MKDRKFKNIKHNARGYKIFKNGQELMKGYKPDVVLKNKNEYIILESEVSTNRKVFIGGMIKAAKFLKLKTVGILVYVIEERKNTTNKQIAEHLKEYYEWIRDKTNLANIFVISDSDYCEDDNPIEILSTEFLHLAESVRQ